MVSFFFKRRFFLFLAFIILIVTSNPIVGNYLMQKLEHPYKPISSYSISKADAIVMLSGVLKKIEIKNNAKYEFGEANRFLSSIDLINQNKADKLIYTAAKVPWIKNRKPEGYILKNTLAKKRDLLLFVIPDLLHLAVNSIVSTLSLYT